MEDEYVVIPHDSMTIHEFITLTADIMFFIGPSSFSDSWGINLIKIEFTNKRTSKHLCCHINHVLSPYFCACFVVRTLMMDMEFKKVKDKIPSLFVNTKASKEHVAEIDCQIGTVKEFTQGDLNTLPFK